MIDIITVGAIFIVLGHDVGGPNECSTINKLCAVASTTEQTLVPALSSFTNSTLCLQAVGHNCSPETLPMTNVIGDRIIVIAVSSGNPPTYTIADSAGDGFSSFLNSFDTRLFITTAPTTAISTTVTATFTGTNGVFYGLFEISASYVATGGFGTGATATLSGSLATSKTISITTTTSGSLVLTGISIPSANSCENLPPGITSVNNGLLSTLNLNATSTGCSTASNGSWTDDELSASATGVAIGTYMSDFAWPTSANFGSYAFELKPSIARSIQLEYDSESQTSSTVVSPGPTTIRSAITSTTFPAGVIVETEGYIAYTAVSTVQPLTFQITGLSATCSTLIATRGVAAAMDFPFSMKCVVFFNGGGNAYSLVYSSPANDAATTIFVNSFRLYGLL